MHHLRRHYSKLNKRMHAHRRAMHRQMKRLNAHYSKRAARVRAHHARRMAHFKRRMHLHKARYIRARKAHNHRMRMLWRKRRAAENRARANLRRQRALLVKRLAKRQVVVAAPAPCTTCNQGPHVTMKSTTLVVKHI
jgi:hypothetical protein